jgi:ATP-dependent DNA helicase PIF1
MVELTEEQQYVFNEYRTGKNIFITGPGGTGKSELLKLIYNDAKHNGIKVHITALTGCAAILLGCGANTIHSFSGIGLCNGSQDVIIEKSLKKRKARANWKSASLLIIDEVSMMSRKIFDVLNELGQYARLNSKPFGRIQVIASGDFYQLPPVGNTDEPHTTQYCFESPQWNTVFPVQIELTHIFRQEDPVYRKMLNQIRTGVVSRRTLRILESCKTKNKSTLGEFTPTKMLPIRRRVDMINFDEMRKLGDVESQVFKMKRSYANNKDRDEVLKMEKSLMCNEMIELKIGCQVMCIINLDLESEKQICNGSQGIIRDFVGNNVKVEFYNGRTALIGAHAWKSEKSETATITQLPLILSWAITIHKSQGATLDVIEVDIGSGIFEVGQTYVALSRVKSLKGLYLMDFSPTSIRVSKRVQQFYRALEENRQLRLEDNVSIPASAAIMQSPVVQYPVNRSHIQYINGNILTATEDLIAHQCNCQTTTGMGLAKAIFDRYPYSNTYRQRLVTRTHGTPGTIHVYGDGENERYVCNMYAQNSPHNRDETSHCRERWFMDCLNKMQLLKYSHDIKSIAFPYKIGCGLAGGNWNKYTDMLEGFANEVAQHGVKVVVYEYTEHNVGDNVPH